MSKSSRLKLDPPSCKTCGARIYLDDSGSHLDGLSSWTHYDNREFDTPNYGLNKNNKDEHFAEPLDNRSGPTEIIRTAKYGGPYTEDTEQPLYDMRQSMLSMLQNKNAGYKPRKTGPNKQKSRPKNKK